jgi:hypothetical protein
LDVEPTHSPSRTATEDPGCDNRTQADAVYDAPATVPEIVFVLSLRAIVRLLFVELVKRIARFPLCPLTTLIRAPAVADQASVPVVKFGSLTQFTGAADALSLYWERALIETTAEAATDSETVATTARRRLSRASVSRRVEAARCCAIA